MDSNMGLNSNRPTFDARGGLADEKPYVNQYAFNDDGDQSQNQFYNGNNNNITIYDDDDADSQYNVN